VYSIFSDFNVKSSSLTRFFILSARYFDNMASNRIKYDQSRNRPPQSIPRKRPADDEEDKWVADEDRFVLRQAKKKAILRVRGGRAKPIDWLAVILRAIDKTDDFLDENAEAGELDIVDPEGVFEGLSLEEMRDLEGDIDTYLVRESNRSNKDYWNVRAMKFYQNLPS
jgi:Conserved mid region of cactin